MIRRGKQKSSPVAFVPDGTTIKALGIYSPTFAATGNASSPYHYDTPPYAGVWDATSFGFTSARRSAALTAGFNAVRIFIDASPFTDARTVGATNTTASLKTLAIANVQNYVTAGFKVILCVDANPAALDPNNRVSAIIDGPSGANFLNYKQSVVDIATALAGSFTPAQVAIELINEPPLDTAWGVNASWGDIQAPALHAAVRAVAPRHTIIVQPRSLASYTLITEFTFSRFDSNTIFSFHPYEIGGFTHQGLSGREGIQGLKFPASDNSGGATTAIANMTTLVNAMGISAGAKTALIASNTTEINAFFTSGFEMSGQTIRRNWATYIDTVVTTNSLHPKQIMAGEFGCVGSDNYNGSTGTDATSRGNYYRAIRTAVENRGWAGWACWQMNGDFNVFNQTDISTHGTTLVSEIQAALFA